MTTSTPILPFYHPTSVVLVDDDSTFLESMEFALCDDFNCQTFENPKEAVVYLREKVSSAAMQEENLLFPTSSQSDSTFLDPGDRTIGVKASFVPNLLADRDRFDRHSVLIVDYSMPGMNGIELLQEIRDLPICKILLTGKADEKVGIDAFNKGLIDCFLTKHDAALVDQLPDRVKELQYAFFQRISKILSSIVSLEFTDFIKDPIFHARFLEVKEQFGAVEYYLVSEPQGILMISSEGRMSFMLVADEMGRQAQYEIAEDQDAPEALLATLRQADVLSLFPTQSGYYEPPFANDWKSYVWPGTPIEGRKKWLYALINNPAVFRSPVPNHDLYCFDAFMTNQAAAHY
jgi:FixJ family two-component response regulator